MESSGHAVLAGQVVRRAGRAVRWRNSACKAWRCGSLWGLYMVFVAGERSGCDRLRGETRLETQGLGVAAPGFTLYPSGLVALESLRLGSGLCRIKMNWLIWKSLSPLLLPAQGHSLLSQCLADSCVLVGNAKGPLVDPREMEMSPCKNEAVSPYKLSEGCATAQHRYHHYSESTKLLGAPGRHLSPQFWPPHCNSLAAPPNCCFSEMESFAGPWRVDVVGGGQRGRYDSQPGMVLSSKGHLAMSGDICGCYNLWVSAIGI